MNGENKWNKAVCTVGDVSLGLYVVHLMMIGYLRDGIEAVSSNTAANICLIFVAALFISVVVVTLLRKYKHTARFLLGKL